MEKGKLYLIPVTLGDSPINQVIPAFNNQIINEIDVYIVENIKVVPLVGPSSILLALMASGFNGQSFCFNGYLPKEQKERTRKLKDLERAAKSKQQTQLFIETPYRNNHVFEDILKNCFESTKLCIAVDITLPTEQITTKTVADWKKTKIDLHKRPCLFLIG